jgi:hypothetical protein
MRNIITSGTAKLSIRVPRATESAFRWIRQMRSCRLRISRQVPRHPRTCSRGRSCRSCDTIRGIFLSSWATAFQPHRQPIPPERRNRSRTQSEPRRNASKSPNFARLICGRALRSSAGRQAVCSNHFMEGSSRSFRIGPSRHLGALRNLRALRALRPSIKRHPDGLQLSADQRLGFASAPGGGGGQHPCCSSAASIRRICANALMNRGPGRRAPPPRRL